MKNIDTEDQDITIFENNILGCYEAYIKISKNLSVLIGQYANNKLYYINLDSSVVKAFRLDRHKGFKTPDYAAEYIRNEAKKFMEQQLKTLVKGANCRETNE